MRLITKRAICSLVALSLFFNLLAGAYILQIHKNYQSNTQILEEKIDNLQKDNDNLQKDKEYYQKEYNKYYQYSIELEQQMGVYRNEP